MIELPAFGCDPRQVDVGVLTHVLQAAPSGVAALDAAGILITANARVVEIAGRPLGALAGRPVHELFAAQEREAVEALVAGSGEPDAASFPDRPFRFADAGAERYLELRCGPPLPVRDGTVTLLGMREVTERVLAAQARRRTAAAQEFLAKTSALLESPLDLAQTLQRVASLAVPAHAELCIIDLVSDSGGLEGAALAAVDPAVGEALRRIRGEHPLDLAGSHPVARALRSDEPLLIDTMDDGSYQLFTDAPEHLALMRQLRYRCAMVVPLTARGHTFGVISLLYMSEQHLYTEHDLEILVEVARRAALALDNARLYARERRIADTLQRSLQPSDLPVLPGLSLAARYEPGDGEIGGDWYDVISLADGRVGCVVGDIVGRGVDAAVAMGQLRGAVRIYAAERASAGEVVSAVDQLARSLGVGFMATLVYLIVDPLQETVELSSAGHPPPLLLSVAGDALFLASGRSTPIGVGEPDERVSAVESFPRGSTLLVYTDGLIERRGEALDAGMLALARAAVAAPADPEGRLDAVIDALRADGGDDLAVLAVRGG